MDELIVLLQRLGFGEYEARAYLALQQRSPLTGYELAKLSGIPRPNVYTVLQKLEERAVVVRVDAPNGVRYAPIPPAELTQRLENRFHETLATAQRQLEGIARITEQTQVWSVEGREAVLEHTRDLLANVQQRLLIALWSSEARALSTQLEEAAARGADITTLCLEACPQECGGCRGRIYRYRVGPEPGPRSLVLAADGEEVLAGEIDDGAQALAVRTRQRLLVELASWYIQHTVALAGVIEDLGDRLEGLLSPATQATLASVGPVGSRRGWIEHMRQLFGPRRA